MSARGARAALATALLALAAGCAGEQTDGEEVAEADGASALVNGAVAKAGQFPATILINGSCTAAKIAPKKVLTAAHCLYDGLGAAPVLGKGDVLSYRRADEDAPAKAKIADVALHPSFLAACAARPCVSNDGMAKNDAADVAVITLEVDLEGVAVARVDTTPLGRGDRVVVLGYGCEAGAQMAPPETQRLKWAETALVSASAVVHDGSPIDRAGVAQVAASYNVTAGPGMVSARAGLCPGDSGGPLYRWRGAELVVVGVNSNYTFAPTDTVGLAVTNWHTRLDDRSRHQVAKWLSERAR
jgi:secreted trypsin-like serine protease